MPPLGRGIRVQPLPASRPSRSRVTSSSSRLETPRIAASRASSEWRHEARMDRPPGLYGASTPQRLSIGDARRTQCGFQLGTNAREIAQLSHISPVGHDPPPSPRAPEVSSPNAVTASSSQMHVLPGSRNRPVERAGAPAPPTAPRRTPGALGRRGHDTPTTIGRVGTDAHSPTSVPAPGSPEPSQGPVAARPSRAPVPGHPSIRPEATRCHPDADRGRAADPRSSPARAGRRSSERRAERRNAPTPDQNAPIPGQGADDTGRRILEGLSGEDGSHRIRVCAAWRYVTGTATPARFRVMLIMGTTIRCRIVI